MRMGFDSLMLFDSRAGRVVAERTAVMDENLWLVHFYDHLGRRVVSAEATVTDAQMTSFQASLVKATFSTNANEIGYLIEPTPAFGLGKPISVSYYDNYDFCSLFSDSKMPTVTGTCPGLLTGMYDGRNVSTIPSLSRVAVASPLGNFTVIQYDDFGRVVRTDRQTDKGVLTDISTLDWAGNVLTNKHSLKNSTSTYTVSQTNTYDNAGRLTGWTVTYGPGSASGTITYGKYGGVSKEQFGNNIVRDYSYDCHGWLTKVVTQKSTASSALSSDIAPEFFAEALARSNTDAVLTGTKYTEEILYETGTKPRYDGTASAHVASLGGRYDYTFDCHDRLKAADYTAARGSSENFSTKYTYNKVGAPTLLERRGVIKMNEVYTDTPEVFGILDDLYYDWDGARLNLVEAVGRGTDYYGRTGYPLSASGGVAFYEWNDAGMLTKDPSRGITAIKYNPQGQPTKVDFSDGTYVSYKYTCDGELINASTYGKKTGIFPPLLSDRSYCGSFEFDLQGITRVNFPGGYFDDMCNVYYRHADWQGSVDMVTDGNGAVVQHNGYYPYGEPWREPAGQPYLYGGKERMRDNGLNEYDFSARRYNSALALWTTPDPVVHDQTSPYIYCAANPIKFIDPSGCAQFIFKGKIIGDDGKEDTDLYVIPDKTSSLTEGGETIPAIGTDSDDIDRLVKFIETNKGNSSKFTEDFYKQVYKIIGTSAKEKKDVEDMNSEMSKDKGAQNDKDENNREYGGYFTDKGFVAETPGDVSAPKKGGASIKMKQDISSVHSHPSGKDDFGTYRQQPSIEDIKGKSSGTTHYVVGRGSKKIYIYNNEGVISVMDYKKFLKLYENKKK